MKPAHRPVLLLFFRCCAILQQRQKFVSCHGNRHAHERRIRPDLCHTGDIIFGDGTFVKLCPDSSRGIVTVHLRYANDGNIRACGGAQGIRFQTARLPYGEIRLRLSERLYRRRSLLQNKATAVQNRFAVRLPRMKAPISVPSTDVNISYVGLMI